MAQIIKHRRGSLESISSATKRAGELLVVTGSAGITADNGDSLLFVGVDGSTATAANKVLQGSSTPDLSGASYDTSVDGIPFYNTSTEKLYLLNKGGNVEIKASANTGGTGIISGSEQVTISETTGFSAFSSSIASSGSVQDGRLSNLELFSSSQESKDSTLASYTASNDINISNLITSASVAKSANDSGNDRLNALEAFSSSLDSGFVTEAELASATGALESADAAIEGRLDNIESFTSSIDSTIKTKLNVEGVISGSEQVQLGDVTGFTSYSSSVDSRTSALEAAVGAGSNIDGRLNSLEAYSASNDDAQAAQDDRLSALETETGSIQSAQDAQDAQLSSLEAYTASNDSNQSAQDDRLDNLESFSGSLENAIAIDGQNVTINGNFTVSGTQTIVDSTTVQIGDNIIELNGSAAANGGLYIVDATAPNTATGSLLWDTTNDYWVAGPKGSEVKVLLAQGDSVVSGSSQITITDTTGFASFSGSLKTTDDAQNVRLGKLEAYSASNDSAQDAQDGRLDSIESFTSSIDSTIKTKLNVEGVISGSEQVTISDTTGYNDFSSSIATAISASVAASDWANLNGKPAGIVSGSEQVVSYLDGEDVNLGGISGSTLDITGNAKIDGNIVIGGNITIGDASSDTISFGGEIASDILPSPSNTYDLGSATNLFAEIHGTSIYGAINATNGVVSGSSQIVSILDPLNSFTSSINDTIKAKLDAEAVVSSSAQVVGHLLNQATDFGTGRVSGDNFGDAAGTSTFTGSFVGDGSGLTGLATNLSIEDGKGNSDTVDLLNDTLSITSGSGLGVDVTVSNNSITISGVNASTSVKGVASFDGDDFSVSSGNVSIKSGGVRADNLNSDVAGTGISLNGVDNSIEVDYGSTSGTAVEGDTALTVQGTANEIEISGGSITLGAGGTVTIGLPDEVTIQTGSIVGDLQVGADLTVVGNLFVQGTTTTVDSTTIQLGDNIIELNGSGAANGGLLVKDVTNPNTASGSLLWDSTNDYWKGGALGSEKEFARFDSTPTSGSVQVIGASGLLVDAPITSDGTDVSITGDFTIGGLSANSFVVADGSKTLVSIVPSNAGDLIQWNGSSFVASNTVDGGTF